MRSKIILLYICLNIAGNGDAWPPVGRSMFTGNGDAWPPVQQSMFTGNSCPYIDRFTICPSHKGHCGNQWLSQHCAKTCKCGGNNCPYTDRFTACSSYKRDCDNQWLSQHCEKTCKCGDINECLRGSNKCDPNAICTDTRESYTCTCNPGYSGNGFTCLDINECLLPATCDPNASCTNTRGGYACTCNSGYSGDGVTCSDINECLLSANCDPNASSGCPLGFTLDMGDVPGGGIRGGFTVGNLEECGDVCKEEPTCNSFGYSNSRKHCVIYKEENPTSPKYQDFDFCIRNQDSSSCKVTPKDDIGPFYVAKKYTLDTRCISFSENNPSPGNCDDEEYIKEPIRIQGRVLDSRCRPIPGAVMEYWQAAPEWSVRYKNEYTMVDSRCTGIHGDLPQALANCVWTNNANNLMICEAREEPDCITDMEYKAYRGWQKTTSDGSYQLNTVRPGIYDVRPIRHIQFKITVPGHELVTQLYLPQDTPTRDERNLYNHYMNACGFYESRPEQWAKKQDLKCPVRNDPEGARDVPHLTTYNWDVVLNV